MRPARPAGPGWRSCAANGCMCRWLAYRGRPLSVEELLYKTKHSLREQSRHAKLGLETFNGDGFGLGWYGDGDSSARPPSDLGPDVAARTSSDPGLYRSLMPAWSNHTLQSLAAHVVSPFFLAHVRATTGTPVQETNCHPFRHENWLFAHNGSVDGYLDIRHELMCVVDRRYFNSMQGTTDSELMFFLALTFGLADEPL